MPNYTIDLTIFRLKLLLSDHQNPIPSELETRFSTTNIYPPFDPNIHTPVDWDQLSLSTDCNEEDVLLPLNRKLVEDVESLETEVRVRDWTRDVARRMWAGQEGDDDSGSNTTHKNDTAPNRQNSDTNENDQQPSPTTVDNKRDYETGSETEDTRSGKRRRSARIAARQESSSNT